MKLSNFLFSLFLFAAASSYGYDYKLSNIEYNRTNEVLSLVFDGKDVPFESKDPFSLICEMKCPIGSCVSKSNNGDFHIDLYKLNNQPLSLTLYHDGQETSKALQGTIEISQTPRAHIWRFRSELENKIFMLNLLSKNPNPTLAQIEGNAGTI